MQKRKLVLDKEVLTASDAPNVDGGTLSPATPWCPHIVTHIIVLGSELATCFDDSVIVCTGGGDPGPGYGPTYSCAAGSCTCLPSDIPGNC